MLKNIFSNWIAIVVVGVIAFLTLLNCRGVREGKWVQNVFTVAKTLALVVLIVVGLAVALGRVYGPKLLQIPLAVYVEVLRGTPLMEATKRRYARAVMSV